MLERALATVDPDDAATHAMLLRALATWKLSYGDLAESEQDARAALALAERAGSLEERSNTTRTLGHIALSAGDLDGSVRYLTVARDLAHAGTDLGLQSIAEGDLGVALHIRADRTGQAEDYVAAIGHYERDIAVREQLGERRGLATTRVNLAQVYLRIGDTGRARTMIREGIADATRTTLISDLMMTLVVEADRRLLEGDIDGGLELLGVVASHPACTRNDREEIARILSRTSLDEANVDAGMARGAGLDIDELAAQVLADPQP